MRNRAGGHVNESFVKLACDRAFERDFDLLDDNPERENLLIAPGKPRGIYRCNELAGNYLWHVPGCETKLTVKICIKL